MLSYRFLLIMTDSQVVIIINRGNAPFSALQRRNRMQRVPHIKTVNMEHVIHMKHTRMQTCIKDVDCATFTLTFSHLSKEEESSNRHCFTLTCLSAVVCVPSQVQSLSISGRGNDKLGEEMLSEIVCAHTLRALHHDETCLVII